VVVSEVLSEEVEEEVDLHHDEVEEADIPIDQILDLLHSLLQEERFLHIEDTEDLLQDQFHLQDITTITIITTIAEELDHNQPIEEDQQEELLIIDLDILEADLQSTSDLDHHLQVIALPTRE